MAAILDFGFLCLSCKKKDKVVHLGCVPEYL